MPVYEGHGGIAAGTGASVDVPYPETVNENDILFISVGDADDDSCTTPDGWTLVIGTGTTERNWSCVWYWKRALGTESGVETVTSLSADGAAIFGIMVRYSGCITSDPPWEDMGGYEVRQDTTYLARQLVTTGANRLGVCLVNVEDNVGIGIATLWDTLDFNELDGTGGDATLAGISVQMPVATTIASSYGAIGGNDYHSACCLALIPVPQNIEAAVTVTVTTDAELSDYAPIKMLDELDGLNSFGYSHILAVAIDDSHFVAYGDDFITDGRYPCAFSFVVDGSHNITLLDTLQLTGTANTGFVSAAPIKLDTKRTAGNQYTRLRTVSLDGSYNLIEDDVLATSVNYAVVTKFKDGLLGFLEVLYAGDQDIRIYSYDGNSDLTLESSVPINDDGIYMLSYRASIAALNDRYLIIAGCMSGAECVIAVYRVDSDTLALSFVEKLQMAGEGDSDIKKMHTGIFVVATNTSISTISVSNNGTGLTVVDALTPTDDPKGIFIEPIDSRHFIASYYDETASKYVLAAYTIDPDGDNITRNHYLAVSYGSGDKEQSVSMLDSTHFVTACHWGNQRGYVRSFYIESYGDLYIDGSESHVSITGSAILQAAVPSNYISQATADVTCTSEAAIIGTGLIVAASAVQVSASAELAGIAEIAQATSGTITSTDVIILAYSVCEQATSFSPTSSAAHMSGVGSIVAISNSVQVASAEIRATGLIEAAASIAITTDVILIEASSIGYINQAVCSVVITSEAALIGDGLVEQADCAVAVSSDVQLAGSGGITADAAITVTADALMIANGLITQATCFVPTSSAAHITGNGEIVADASVAVSSSAQIEGLGILSAASSTAITSSAELTASGQIEVTVSVAVTANATIEDSGSVGTINQSTSNTVTSASSELKGVGNVEAASTITVVPDVSIIAVADVIASSNIAVSAVAEMMSYNDVAAFSDVAVSSIAEMVGVGLIVASVDIASSSSSELKGVGRAEANSDVVVTTDAAMRDAGADVINQATCYVPTSSAAHMTGVGIVSQSDSSVSISAESAISAVGQMVASASTQVTADAKIFDSAADDIQGAESATTVTCDAVVTGVGDMSASSQVTTTANAAGILLAGLDADASVSISASASIVGSAILLQATSLVHIQAASEIYGIKQVLASAGITVSTDAVITGVGRLTAGSNVLIIGDAVIAGSWYIVAGGDVTFISTAIIGGAGEVVASADIIISTNAAMYDTADLKVIRLRSRMVRVIRLRSRVNIT